MDGSSGKVGGCTVPRRKRVYCPLSNNVLENQATHLQDAAVPLPEIHNIVSTSKIICVIPSSSLTEEEEATAQTMRAAAAGLDLEQIHRNLQCSHYDKKRFAAMTIRIEHPTVTALLFTSGRLVITGSKCWYECMLASLLIVQMLKEIQPENYFYVNDCEIQNVVANVVIPGSNPDIPANSRSASSLASSRHTHTHTARALLSLICSWCCFRLNIHAMMTMLNASKQEHVCQYRKNLFPGLVYRPPNSPIVVLCFSSGKCVVTGGKNIEDVLIGWKLLWQNIKKFVVDPQGRAFLDHGRVLQPRIMQ